MRIDNVNAGGGLDDAEGWFGSHVAVLQNDLSHSLGQTGNETRGLFQSTNVAIVWKKQKKTNSKGIVIAGQIHSYQGNRESRIFSPDIPTERKYWELGMTMSSTEFCLICLTLYGMTPWTRMYESTDGSRTRLATTTNVADTGATSEYRGSLSFAWTTAEPVLIPAMRSKTN